MVHKGTIVPCHHQNLIKQGCALSDNPRRIQAFVFYSWRTDQIDFIYNSGTVGGVMGEKNINVPEEDVLIMTIFGQQSISELYGHIIFGKTRILNVQSILVLLSQKKLN